jgi:hypothetical protein
LKAVSISYHRRGKSVPLKIVRQATEERERRHREDLRSGIFVIIMGREANNPSGNNAFLFQLCKIM